MRMIAENDRWHGGDVASEKLEREQGRAMSYTAMHDLRLDCYYPRSRRRWLSPFPGHSAKTPHRTALERRRRSEEHTSELQSLMRISYAVFCLKKKTTKQ